MGMTAICVGVSELSLALSKPNLQQWRQIWRRPIILIPQQYCGI